MWKWQTSQHSFLVQLQLLNPLKQYSCCLVKENNSNIIKILKTFNPLSHPDATKILKTFKGYIDALIDLY